MSQLGDPLWRSFPPEKTESRSHWWEVMPKCHWELMNLNETGCKARVPVAILYGACGPAKAFNAPFWAIWGALRRYERKDCDVNFEFRRRPRLVYGSSPTHQGEAHFHRRQPSVHCSLVWCTGGSFWTALRPFRKGDVRDLSVLEQRPPRAGSGRRRGMNIYPSFVQLSSSFRVL